MEELSAWIRRLIFLLVAAGVVDMILPRGDLRRYVDVVVGLVIIATVLTPVLGWLGEDLDSALAGAMATFNTSLPGGGAPGVPDDTQRRWQDEAGQVFSQQVARWIKDGLRRDLGWEVAAVEVTTGSPEGAGWEVPAVTGVTVWLEDTGTDGDGAIDIAPVRIGDEYSAPVVGRAPPGKEVREFKEWLEQRWGYAPPDLRVVAGGPPSRGVGNHDD